MPELSLVAIAAGLVTGAVILTFRTLIDLIVTAFTGGPEAFEALPALPRAVLPLAGALLVGLALTRLPAASRRYGVTHVMERLSRHQGRMPLGNAVGEFAGGITALAAGVSGGREGPAIHLGAASASLLGQALQVPHNSLRVLVACGVAAAIAGSFNTPMAGVVFAMEVVMMEYTIGSFIPVILAAVTTTLLTHWFLGPDPAFQVAPLRLASLLEIPFIVLCGVVIGALAAGYARLVQLFARLHRWPFWRRALAAGAITAAGSLLAPQIMGVGYDTVDAAMTGQLTLATLAAVVVLKTISSAASVGLGLPVGVIGPTFVIGAAIGGVMGILGAGLGEGASASSGFYVMLGMAAMMAASLQAPLAALMAVLELTANPNVILPAMLIIVVATLVTSSAFRQPSVFLSSLRAQGLEYPPSPVRAHLRRVGVAAIMNRSFAALPVVCTPDAARKALAAHPRWIVAEDEDGRPLAVLSAGDLQIELDSADGLVDLLQIPARRRDVADIDYLATVEEAQSTLRRRSVEALCVRRTAAPMLSPVRGIVTLEDIDNYQESAL
ncbi:MAG TPA: chloride channel protein [Pseudomonadales bacterium]